MRLKNLPNNFSIPLDTPPRHGAKSGLYFEWPINSIVELTLFDKEWSSDACLFSLFHQDFGQSNGCIPFIIDRSTFLYGHWCCLTSFWQKTGDHLFRSVWSANNFVGFSLSWNTLTVDCCLVYSSYVLIHDSSQYYRRILNHHYCISLMALIGRRIFLRFLADYVESNNNKSFSRLTNHVVFHTREGRVYKYIFYVIILICSL